jgi:hypothetical protein
MRLERPALVSMSASGPYRTSQCAQPVSAFEGKERTSLLKLERPPIEAASIARDDELAHDRQPGVLSAR